MELPSHGSHGLCGREEEVCRWEAERDDDFGADDPDLLNEVWSAEMGFVDRRSRVVWGSGFEHIGDVDRFSAETHRDDHFVEEFACSSYKWSACLVFLLTWRFTYEHEIRGWVAFAEDDVGEVRVERSVRSVGCVFLFECNKLCLGVFERFVGCSDRRGVDRGHGWSRR